MSQPSDQSRPGPPRNPGLQRLIDGKRRWSQTPVAGDLKRGFHGWHERGYLPHRDEPGLVQFVTFRLADSFPESLRAEWEHLLSIEDQAEQRRRLESYLDQGRGHCHLRRPDIAKLVEGNFRSFGRVASGPDTSSSQAIRYDLRAWVIMPNHVHVLFKVGTTAPMSEIIGAWKRHTARLANELLGRRGPFWSQDYYDTYVRDDAHELRTIHYLENNPAKAKLVLDPKDWPWSSARFRDEFGILRL